MPNWNFLPITLKNLRVESLIIPHFDYCNSLLTDLSDNLTQRLKRVHNVCVRFICNIRRSDHVTPSLEQLSWLCLRDRRTIQSLSLLYKILHTSSPNIYQIASVDTRSQQNIVLSIPLYHSTSYSSSLTVSLARTWNLLPFSIRDCPTLS